MPGSILLIYLDDVHLADTLFLQGLAREIRGMGTSEQWLLMVHGSGEQAERRLEGEGIFRERENGVLRVASEEEARMVDQVFRDTNRKLAAFFTDQIVPAVNIQGDHRRLLQVSDDGTVSTGSTDWLRDIVEAGTIPVISSLAIHAEGEGAREIPAHETLLALGKALDTADALAVFFLRRNQEAVTRDGRRLEKIGLEDLPGEEVLPAPELVYEVVERGLDSLLTNPAGLCASDGPRGTHVTR